MQKFMGFTGFYWFVGVVEDVEDPLKLGRVRVRFHGIHSADPNELPTKDLPWATPMQGVTSAALYGNGESPTGLLVGSTVVGFFLDNEEAQMPVVMGSIAGIPITDKTPARKYSSTSSVVPQHIENAIYKSLGNIQSIIPDLGSIAGLDTSLYGISQFQSNTVLGDTDTSTEISAVERGTFLGSLTNDQYLSYREAIAQSESSGDPTVVNSIGYLGKYQFGLLALEDLGYIRRGTAAELRSQDVSVNSGLDDPGYWTGKDGIESKDDFLASESTQDSAMEQYTRLNYRYLINNGVVTSATGPEELGGYLAVASLLGAGGAADYRNGKNNTDAYGSSANEYYILGYQSIGGNTPPSTPSSVGAPNAPQTYNIGNELHQPVSSKQTIPYPSQESIYIGEQDVHRLARGERIEQTIVTFKDTARQTGVRLPLNLGTWDQPYSPYNARYPHNHVRTTPNGLVEEFDDTPNNVRLHWYHPSGTFKEVDRNGTTVQKITGDNFEVYERNNHVYIKGSADVTVDGKCNIYVVSDVNIQVDGDVTALCKNDVSLTVNGDMDVNVKETFKLKANEIIIESQTYDQTTETTHNVKATTYNNKTQSATFDTSTMWIDATSLYHTGGRTYVNSDRWYTEPDTGNPTYLIVPTGTSKSLGNPQTTELPTPGNRVNIVTPSFDPLYVPTRQEYTSIHLDDVGVAGVLVDGQLNEQPFNEQQIQQCGEFINDDQIPDSVVLSKYCTLGSVSTRAYYPHKVRAQHGLTEGQIVCNLKYLCENVIDKIIDKYGQSVILITSGFRTAKTNSDHEYGQAVDIQFTDLSPSDYYERAIELQSVVGSYSKLILEYSSAKPSGWIHIAYKSGSLQQATYTYYDHSKVSNGLTRQI